MGVKPHNQRGNLLNAIKQKARQDSWLHEGRERHTGLSPTVRELNRLKGIATRARGNRAFALWNASDYSSISHSRKSFKKEAATERAVERSANESINKLKLKLRKPTK